MNLVLAALLLASLAQPPAPQRAVAITLDDLPKALDSGKLDETRQTTEAILAALKRHNAPAVGFVNEQQLFVPGEMDERIAVLRLWVDAGMVLGNHTFSHPNLRDTPVERYEDEVIRGEVVTRWLMRPREPYTLWFRHPFTNTGTTKEIKEGFEAFLRTRGYHIAPHTVEHADYIFNDLYRRARTAGDAELQERLRTAYLEQLDVAFDFFEGLSRETFGREIPQVLLIHANDLNADCLDAMLARLEARGYRFVNLDEAVKDEAYRTPDEYLGTNGPSWLHRWRATLKMPGKLRDEPDPPSWVLQMYQQARAAGR